MILNDFSQNFDTLLNSFAATAAFGSTDSPISIELDEYEKSVFLTDAQQDICLSFYNGRNTAGLGFEETEEIRRYLSNLVKEAQLEPISTTSGKPLGVDSKSKFFTLPSDLWFITYESVNISNGKCASHTSMEVVPVLQDEYHRLKKNPFRGANNRRSLRLDLSEGIVEIVSKFDVTSYYVRYLKKLDPIILVDLEDGMSINGVSEKTPCKMHDALHQKILERAVQLAAMSRGLVKNNENRDN